MGSLCALLAVRRRSVPLLQNKERITAADGQSESLGNRVWHGNWTQEVQRPNI